MPGRATRRRSARGLVPRNPGRIARAKSDTDRKWRSASALEATLRSKDGAAGATRRGGGDHATREVEIGTGFCGETRRDSWRFPSSRERDCAGGKTFARRRDSAEGVDEGEHLLGDVVSFWLTTTIMETSFSNRGLISTLSGIHVRLARMMIFSTRRRRFCVACLRGQRFSRGTRACSTFTIFSIPALWESNVECIGTILGVTLLESWM